jgi:broad specificity phosphatase PhoE
MEILFIRHGETELNVENITHKKGDQVGLNERGKKQARKTAKVCRDHEVTVVYTSPELRARETAEIIGEELGLTPIASDKLAERNLGDWLGRPWAEVLPLLEAMDAQTRYTFIPPNGESMQQKEARLEIVLREIVALQQNAAVVTHNGSLKGLRRILTNQPLEESFNSNFANASVTIFGATNGIFTEKAVNDTNHLDRLA